MWAPMRSLPWQNFKNVERHFEWMGKISISPRAILTIYTLARRARMAQFFLKIDILVQHRGTSPQVKMAPRFSLHPCLWLLIIHN